MHASPVQTIAIFKQMHSAETTCGTLEKMSKEPIPALNGSRLRELYLFGMFEYQKKLEAR